MRLRSANECAGSWKAGPSRPGPTTESGMGPQTGKVDSAQAGKIIKLTLIPEEVRPDDGRQLGFWGHDAAAGTRAARALARVQGLLGPRQLGQGCCKVVAITQNRYCTSPGGNHGCPGAVAPRPAAQVPAQWAQPWLALPRPGVCGPAPHGPGAPKMKRHRGPGTSLAWRRRSSTTHPYRRS